jgi:hypothetical protein
MSGAAFAAMGAVGGALITAVASAMIGVMQRRSALHDEHLLRAFEKHLPHYEQVFVNARTVQDSLRHFEAVSERAVDRSDPFIFQLLEMSAAAAHRYCVAVDWNHNPGMVYLDLKLESRCLFARDLLLRWLSTRRIHSGHVASIRRNNEFEPISLPDVKALRVGDYQELRIETQRLVANTMGDKRMFLEIDSAISAVIRELKAIMAY